MMGPQEHVNKLTIEIQILLYWNHKYLKFAKGWKVVERCLTSDSGQETCWKRSNLRYSWNSKEEERHNNKNEVNTSTFLAKHLLMLLAISIEVQKKKKHDNKKSGKKTKTFLAAEVEIEFKTMKRNTHRQGKKISCCSLQAKKGHFLFCNLRYSWNSKGLRRKQNKNKAMLTFAFKISLKTTLPSQNQEFRHSYEARS